MKFKIVSIVALNFISATAFCMDQHSKPFVNDGVPHDGFAVIDGIAVTRYESGFSAPKKNAETKAEKPQTDLWRQQKAHITDKLEKGINVPDIDEWLHRALMKDDIAFEAFLLQHGANPKANSLPMPIPKPLVFYARSVAALQLLEQHGADLRVVDRGFTLLHEAANGYNSDDELFDYLLERLNPYQLTGHGETLWQQIAFRPIVTNSFIHRGQKLLSLGLSPYERGVQKSSAIDRIKMEISGEDSVPKEYQRKELLAALQAQLAYAERCPREDQ